MANLQSNQSKFILLLFSRVWVAVIGIVLVPIYVRIIGAESYGLVAFSGTLAGSLAILDLGLSTAISRQLSRMQVDGSSVRDQRNLFYSVEVVYWAVALVAGLLIFLLAHPIATYWVKTKSLPIATIESAVKLMGILFAFSFPTSVYTGVFNAMSKQVSNAIINISFSTLKAVGVIVVLNLISPSILAFFCWHVLVTLIFTLIYRYWAWAALPKATVRSIFSIVQLKTIWRFAAGMTGISLVTFFLMQIDKIVVSKLVTLDQVGYYNLAFMVAGGISQFISPLQPIIFPKFSALAASGNETELVQLYHKYCRWVSIIVFPIGFMLIFFAHEILWLWTKNSTLTAQTAPILQVVVAGTLCNSMMVIPYYFMLAKGITKFTIYQNTIAAVILTPLLFWWTNQYGVIGASFVWLAVNAGYVVISIPILHQLYLKGERKRWYLHDFLSPLFISIAIIFASKIFKQNFWPEISFLSFLFSSVIVFLFHIIFLSELRKFVANYFHIFKFQ